jgi:hypothetical protein
MEPVLLAVTIISVLLAIFGLTSARRAQRRERERSEARVAALSAAADAHGAADGGWTQVAGEWQWTSEPHGIRGSGLGFSSERETRGTDQIPNPESPITGSSDGASDRMFGTVQRDEPAGNRLPMLAAAALIVMLGGALIFLNTSASDEHEATVAEVAHTQPLELVSLGHARDARLLTISGAVRNPSTGAKLEGLTAVVSLLDREGALVSTKDVPLDYRALGPGEEAPFKVSIPDPGSIARYRVSFRAGTDVVPHVDRRSDTKLASALQETH